MSRDRLLGESAELLDDPIVAISTPPGRAATGKLRLSGSAESVDAILDRVLGARVRTSLKDRRAQLASVLHPESGEEIDRGLVLRMCGPRSYTGEDVVEIDLHGNPVLLRAGIEALELAGARPAKPGEFTRRAVLNGRLDLVEAEAVDALVRAESLAAARIAGRHLGGELTQRLAEWREQLLALAVALEALVDFPEEVDEAELLADLQRVGSLGESIGALARSFTAGRRMLDGSRVVLAGPVNAGKSTLFNLLLGHHRAIVSPVPGTTRDIVSETVTWQGQAFRLEDTAGLRSSSDPVESEGVVRGSEAAERADLLVQVRDARALEPGLQAPALGVATHADLLSEEETRPLEECGWILVDAPAGLGVEGLREALVEAGSAAAPAGELLIHTERQRTALLHAEQALQEALRVGADEPVLAALAVRAAGRALEELAGRWSDEEVLDSLFERFCIGK